MTTARKDAFARRSWMRMASIFLAFAILCSLFYIPCYYYIRQINRDNVLESHQRKLDIGMRTFNISIKALSNMDDHLFQSPEFRSVQYVSGTGDLLALNDLRKMVASYLDPYDMIAEAGVSIDNELLFLRNILSLERDELNWRHYLSCSAESFVEAFNGQQCVLPTALFSTHSYGSYDAITLAFCWSRINNIYLFATYPLDTLLGYLVDDSVLETGSIALYAGDMLVASRGQLPKGGYETISATIDNTLHLRVDIHLSDAYIDHDLQGMHSLVNIFLAVMILAMIVWIVAFALVAARPINRINAALRSSSHLDSLSGASDPTSAMVEGIQQLDSKLTDYSRQLDEQKERIRIQTLEKAIYRGLYSAESVQELYEILPGFPKRWRMALVQYTADETELDEKSVQMLFVEEIRKALGRRVLSVSRNALVVIFAPEDRDGPLEHLEAVLARLEADGMPATYTLSPYYDDPTLLADAFQQLEYESIVLQQQPAQASPSKGAPISMQQLHTLFLALQCGDGSAAVAALKHGTIGLAESGDFFVAQYTYRMVANLLVRIKLESTCNLNDIPIPAFRAGKVGVLFGEELPACIMRITDRMAQQRENQSQSLEEEILHFIEENIANPQLCRTLVTDHFRISAPTLQKRLNASVGKTFSAYVEDLRLNRAQQLLQETDMSMQEIADAVGYANGNSFYKAYKRRFGEAPRSARKEQ